MGKVDEGELRSTMKVLSSTTFNPENWASAGTPCFCRSSKPLMLAKKLAFSWPLVTLALQDQALVKDLAVMGVPSENLRPSARVILYWDISSLPLISEARSLRALP